VGCWHGYLSGDADLHMAQLMPVPLTVSCFSKIQIGFTFLVPAHLGSPGQRAIKRVCVTYLLLTLSESNVPAVQHSQTMMSFLYKLSFTLLGFTPTRHKISHFEDILPNESLGSLLKNH